MSGRSGGHFSAVCYWHTCASRGKATTLFRLPVHASRHLQAQAGWMRHSACILMQRTGGRAVRGALTCFVYIFTGQRTTFKRLDPLLKAQSCSSGAQGNFRANNAGDGERRHGGHQPQTAHLGLTRAMGAGAAGHSFPRGCLAALDTH